VVQGVHLLHFQRPTNGAVFPSIELESALEDEISLRFTSPLQLPYLSDKFTQFHDHSPMGPAVGAAGAKPAAPIWRSLLLQRGPNVLFELRNRPAPLRGLCL
jgi:hypothetical protein